ncbi:hypothetical protein CCACVL1_04255, partial [Corchorus capsularis]
MVTGFEQFGVVPADSTTFKYLEDKISVPYEPVFSDAKARFLVEVSQKIMNLHQVSTLKLMPTPLLF